MKTDTLYKIIRRETPVPMPRVVEGNALLPFLLMDASYQVFVKGVRDMQINDGKIRRDIGRLGEKYKALFRYMFNGLTEDERIDLTDAMDAYEARLDKYVWYVRNAMNNQTFSLEDRQLRENVVNIQMCLLFAQAAICMYQLMYHKKGKSMIGLKVTRVMTVPVNNEYMLAIEAIAHRIMHAMEHHMIYKNINFNGDAIVREVQILIRKMQAYTYDDCIDGGWKAVAQAYNNGVINARGKARVAASKFDISPAR